MRSKVTFSIDWAVIACRSFHTRCNALLSIAASTLVGLRNAAVPALAVALAVGMLSPPFAQAQSGSSRFIPTFLVYYGGGPQLVAADAAKLAKYDMIDIDRFRYNQIGANTWAAIKSINPDSTIYLYQMGPEAPSHLDSTSPLYLNGLGRYNNSRNHPMGSLNGDHPGLFQRDAAGNRIYSVGFSNPGAGQYWYLMDFGSSAYQSYWITATKADIVDQPWVADGVFVDNCVTRAAAAGYNAGSAWYSSNSAWSTAMNSFVTAISAGMRAHGQKLWCNKGDTRFPDGVAAWQALDASATPPDVLLEEGAFAVEWGADTQFYPEADWKRQVDIMGAMKNSKVALMSHTKLMEGQSGIDNWGKPVTFWQTLWYSLGSFLLGKNDAIGNSYFMFNGGSGYNRIWWYDEYERIDLGKALAPYTVKTIGGVNIYSREFEKGFVFVNPSATNVGSIALAQPLRQITHENLLLPLDALPVVGAFALNGHSAAMFMKTSADTGADSIAPSVPTGLTAAAVSSTQVNLSWNPSTDNVGVKGYYIYLNDAPLTTTTGTSFQHTGLAAGTTYNYRVSAYDAVPNHSAWTAAVAATPTLADTQAPSVPTGLGATAVSATQVNLSWNPSTDNVGVKGYYIYLNDAPLTTTTGTSFQHTGLAAGTTYNYRVSAYDAVPNHSAWTAAVAATPTATLAIVSFQASAVTANMSYALAYTGTPVRLQVFLDTDTNAATGYPVKGAGANYLVEISGASGNLYAYSGSGGAWGWRLLKAISFSNANGVANISVARKDLGSPNRIDAVAAIADTGKTVFTEKIRQ